MNSVAYREARRWEMMIEALLLEEMEVHGDKLLIHGVLFAALRGLWCLVCLCCGQDLPNEYEQSECYAYVCKSDEKIAKKELCQGFSQQKVTFGVGWSNSGHDCWRSKLTSEA